MNAVVSGDEALHSGHFPIVDGLVSDFGVELARIAKDVC